MTKEEFYKTEKLYHYTCFETAKNILKTNELWFNHLKNMNDINELYRPMFFEKVSPRIEALARKEIGKYQQISLAQDYCRYGFEIPAMWGHYADCGNGVCLVFDKEKLLKKLPKGTCHGRVDYVSYDHSFAVCFRNNEKSIAPFGKEEIKDIFFKKTCDWSYEQEYRILICTEKEERYKLHFGDALIALIIRNAYDEDVYHNVNFSSKYLTLRTIAKSSIIILDYGAFLGTRLLQYMGYDKEHEHLWDDALWSSDDGCIIRNVCNNVGKNSNNV